MAALAALAAVAWAVTANRMRGMDMGPNTDPGARLWSCSPRIVHIAERC